MNRLLCLLSGGHRYEDKNLKTKTVGEKCVITNVCIKCGKKYETHLLWKDILRGEELMEHIKEGAEK